MSSISKLSPFELSGLSDPSLASAGSFDVSSSNVLSSDFSLSWDLSLCIFFPPTFRCDKRLLFRCLIGEPGGLGFFVKSCSFDKASDPVDRCELDDVCNGCRCKFTGGCISAFSGYGISVFGLTPKIGSKVPEFGRLSD